MPVKKVEKTEKTVIKKKSPKKFTAEPAVKPEKKIVAKTNEIEENELPREILENPNLSPIFDVFLYRELFMALREKLDDLYEKRERSEKAYAEYDDSVYSITTNALNEVGAQDFLSYCYKKGKYDFCLMNYEKYMKWSLLAAANGNAFSLSKLQIFLTNAIEDVLSLENHSYMLDFLELEPNNYYIFLSKLICEEIVKILDITPENLIKMPEVYQEQNEDLLRLFDNAKMDAAKAVKQTLQKAIEQLVEYVKIENEKTKESKNKPIEPEPLQEIKEELKPEQKEEKSSQPAVKKPKIKKFRY